MYCRTKLGLALTAEWEEMLQEIQELPLIMCSDSLTLSRLGFLNLKWLGARGGGGVVSSSAKSVI